MLQRLKQPGGRFYTFALLLAGPPILVMCASVIQQMILVQAIDLQAFGVGVASIIGAVGIGSGVSKIGSSQQARYSSDRDEA